MHKIALSEDAVARVKMRLGKPHPFDAIDPHRTALVVIDMQNYFVKQGHQSEVPAAREIVPNINRLAAEVRRRGGHVVWVRNGTADTRESWSNYHSYLQTPERSERRLQSMDIGADGYEYWHLNDIRPEDGLVTKKRYSAFLQGSSNIERRLRERGVDTVLITGTATNVCCESSARDAMMLNFKTIMVSGRSHQPTPTASITRLYRRSTASSATSRPSTNCSSRSPAATRLAPQRRRPLRLSCQPNQKVHSERGGGRYRFARFHEW